MALLFGGPLFYYNTGAGSLFQRCSYYFAQLVCQCNTLLNFHSIIHSPVNLPASALVNSIFSTMGDDIGKWLVDTTFRVSVGLSLGTNIIATSLIGYIYW